MDIDCLNENPKIFEKPETQEKFSTDYDESKVIDIKAMGLVKKRNRNDLEKDPNSGSSKGMSNGNDNKQENIDENKKMVKNEKGETVIAENK